MPTPQFILDLREKVGHTLLWLPGTTVVVLRNGRDGVEVLCNLRSDLAIWSPIAGIVEPGEEPHETAIREAREEAGIEIEIEALVWVDATDVVTYPNGDQCVYLDHTFRAWWVAGEARVNDDESLDMRWWTIDSLPSTMRPIDRRRIDIALANPRPPLLGRAAELPQSLRGKDNS